MFYKENFKYISFLPGGFEDCHKFVQEQNAKIMHLFILNKINQPNRKSQSFKDQISNIQP